MDSVAHFNIRNAIMSSVVYLLHVYVKPNGFQNKVEYWIDAKGKYWLQLRVIARAKESKANQAIVGLIARELGIAKSSIEIIRGLSARYKVLRITPWSDALADKLPKLTPLPTLFAP